MTATLSAAGAQESGRLVAVGVPTLRAVGTVGASSSTGQAAVAMAAVVAAEKLPAASRAVTPSV